MRSFLKNNSIWFLSGLLAASSSIHWAIPAVSGAAAFSLAVILIIPEITISLFYFGNPIMKALFFTDSVMFIFLIFILLSIFTIIAINFHKKIIFPHIDWFHILLFILIVWLFITLFWTPNLGRGFHKWRTWIITSVIPLELVIIMGLSGIKLKRIPDITIFLGIILLIISFITLKTQSFNPLQRFNIEGSDWNYARSLGFLLLTCVWLFDKRRKLFYKILIIIISLFTIYFLVKAATRAPFAIAIFFASLYLLIFSKIKVSTKIIIFSIFLFSVFTFMSGSYLFLRIAGLQQSVEFSSFGRLIIWKFALNNLHNVPLWGIGIVVGEGVGVEGTRVAETKGEGVLEG